MKQFSDFNLNGHFNGQTMRTWDPFNRRLQGFAVFTGTPHWHTGITYQPDRITVYAERGRRARSKVIVSAIAHLRLSVMNRFRDGLAWISERHRTKLAVQELSPLSARMLEDIGVTRHDIASLAAGTVTVEQINARRHVQKSPRVRLVPDRTPADSSVTRMNAPARQQVMDRAA